MTKSLHTKHEAINSNSKRYSDILSPYSCVSARDVLHSVNINMDWLALSHARVMGLAVIWSLLQWSHTSWRWGKTARHTHLSPELCFTDYLQSLYSILSGVSWYTLSKNGGQKLAIC